MNLAGWFVLSLVSNPDVEAPPQEATPASAMTQDQPSPWSQRRSGRGLAVASAATGTLGWSMSLGVIALQRKDCGGFEGCLSPILGLSVVRALANATAFGLAIPAGLRAGRYDATHTPPSPAFERRSKAFIAVGASALSVGAAGWAASWVVRLKVVPACGTKTCFVGYAAGLQTSFALAGAGAGLLTYGLARRGTSAKARSAAPVSSLQVVPSFGSQQRGLMVAGRF